MLSTDHIPLSAEQLQEKNRLLEQQLEQLKAEATARDAVFREKLAAAGLDSGEAITRLEAAHSAKHPDQRDSARETDERQATLLFGRGSNARAANELAMTRPNEYKRLKVIAKRLGRL